MAALPSGIVIRPSSFWRRLSRSSSRTELAVGFVLLGCVIGLRSWPCWAGAGALAATAAANAKTAKEARNAWNLLIIEEASLLVFPMRPMRIAEERSAPSSSDCDGLAIGRLPAPGTRAVAALQDALLVDLGDDLAVSGKERFRRAHLSAQRQLALGEAVGAVFDVFRRRSIRFRARGAVGAFVHLAA